MVVHAPNHTLGHKWVPRRLCSSVSVKLVLIDIHYITDLAPDICCISLALLSFPPSS